METEDTREYAAVVNDEGQHSIWPTGKSVPAGWMSTGKTGSKAECLAYIEQVWTDMRPLSLQKKMAQSVQ